MTKRKPKPRTKLKRAKLQRPKIELCSECNTFDVMDKSTGLCPTCQQSREARAEYKEECRKLDQSQLLIQRKRACNAEAERRLFAMIAYGAVIQAKFHLEEEPLSDDFHMNLAYEYADYMIAFLNKVRALQKK